MKNKYLVTLFAIFISLWSYAQEAPVAEIKILTPISVCNPGDCTTLVADYFKIKPTNGYTVEPIFYQNLFAYTGGQILNASGDDNFSSAFDLPFKFCFYGQTYDKVIVGTNGFISFNAALAGQPTGYIFNNTIPSTSTPTKFKNAIYGVYQDTNIASPPVQNAGIQNVNYYAGGTAPNRFFVANFNRLPQFSCGGTLGTSYDTDIGLQTTQIVIYETTNIVDVYVYKRIPCNSWQAGRGTIGIQNATGSDGLAPPARNTGNWSVLGTAASPSEAWRFTPSAADPNPPLVEVKWYNEAGELIGTGDSVEVCPTVNQSYTAIATYFRCGQSDKVVVQDTYLLEIEPPLPVNDPLDISVCTEDPIDIGQNTYILDGADPDTYSIYYFLDETAAIGGSTSQALPASTVANFTTTSTDPVPIYVLIVDEFGYCSNVRTFFVEIGSPGGTFSYPPDTDATPTTYCFNSNSALAPVPVDLSAGGTYSVIAPNPTDVLTINADTGVLDLTGATAGTYTIKYFIPANATTGCPEYSTETTVTIESCIDATVANSGPHCQGTATFDITTTYTETTGVTTTYEWKDNAGAVVSTVKSPTLPLPAAAGSYTYILIITQNGTPSAPFSTELIVHPTPTASFVSVSTTICTNASTTVVFTGTPNSSLTISDGSTTYNVPIDASGNGEYVTPALANDTTYSLVSITGSTVPACSATLTGSILISVGLPTASIVKFTDAVICSGTATGLEITGTPGATVSYTKEGVAQTPVVLPASGLLTIPTGMQTVTATTVYTYALTGVVSNSTPPCSDTITGQSATLTVNALPTATFLTTTPSICEGTSAILEFTGTPNAIVTYNNGVTDLTTTLNATGTSSVTTAAISATTTYTLVKVEVTSSGVTCSQTLTGNVTITMKPNVAITSPTANYTVTICPGTSQTFTVVATGANPTYQWYKNGTAITANATGASYTINPVVAASAGDYTVIVSGDCGLPQTSVIATLVVSPETIITTQPVTPAAVCEGTPVPLSVNATGGGTLTYQWFKGTTAIAGATSATYTLNNPVSTDSGSYTVKVTGTCGTVTSNAVVVTINKAPGITTQPKNSSICVGQTATFEVVATGSNLIYQWFKGTTSIPNANASIYNIPNATEADSGTFYCQISSASCPDIQTVTVDLLVKPLPIATISEGNPSTICAGESTQIIFNGTPGAVVIYKINGGSPETVELNATTGEAIVATGILNATTVYELISVTYTGVDACSQNLTGSATITVNPLPTVTLQDGYICIDPITLAVTRPYLLNTGLNEAEFTFVWSDANGVIPMASNSFYEANAVGQYSVTITNIITGCKGSAVANVDSSSPPTDFDYTVTGFFANNPTVVINATPLGQYEYQMDFGPFQQSNVFENLTAGTHTITVRDAQACDVLTKEVLIIDYPRYFTPNGDGINDTWNIRTIDGVSFTKIHIFDRFGKLLKEMSASGLGWDGTYNGKALPATDYWFTIQYQEAGLNKEFRAHFAMKR